MVVVDLWRLLAGPVAMVVDVASPHHTVAFVADLPRMHHTLSAASLDILQQQQQKKKQPYLLLMRGTHTSNNGSSGGSSHSTWVAGKAGVSVAASLFVAAVSARALTARRQRPRRTWPSGKFRARCHFSTTCRATAESDDSIGSDDAASRLEREAAKLRAEAAALESDRRAARARQLLGGNSTVGPEELVKTIKDMFGLSLSAKEVAELTASDSTVDTGTNNLGFDDLASKIFDTTLERLEKAQNARLSAELAERQQQLAEEAKREKAAAAAASLFSADSEDGGIQGRVLACLPYLLPLVDGIQFGGPAIDLVPAVYPILAAFSPLMALKSAIPFGTFIFLVAFQFLCRNSELPGLLRYNLRQACVIDILILLPDFITGFTGFQLPGADLPLFILMVLSVGYSVVLTSLGKLPNSLGFISDATERGL